MMMSGLVFFGVLTAIATAETYDSNRTSYAFKVHSADPHEFPWQVSIQLKEDGKYEHTCSGSIISDQWVLTSAMCAPIGSDMRVVAGAHLIDESEPSARPFKVDIVSMEPEKVGLALLKIAGRFPFDMYTIAPIRLPNSTDHDKFDCEVCACSGWGTLEMPLLKKNLPVEQLYLCRLSYPGRVILEDSLCAHDKSPFDLDVIDDGSPFACVVDGVYTLVGVYAFGSRFAPGVFSRVSSYRDWIDQEIAPQETHESAASNVQLGPFISAIELFLLFVCLLYTSHV